MINAVTDSTSCSGSCFRMRADLVGGKSEGPKFSRDFPSRSRDRSPGPNQAERTERINDHWEYGERTG